jgi:hypothetical protein
VNIWRAAADQLAVGAFSQRETASDSALHNRLLIAGYFWVCNHPNESAVRNELESYSTSLLSVQGTLVDIVERVSHHGIEDFRLPQASPPQQYTLKHEAIAPLLQVLVQEAQNVVNDHGFLLRWLGTLKTDTSVRVDPGLMQALRKVAYRHYEYSVLATMALSGVEQLLRTFANKMGLFEGHVRFTPGRLQRVVTACGGDAQVADAIATIYDNEKGNLRNRILHGAQLHIARSQYQSVSSIVSPSVNQQEYDRFAPENVFFLCFDALKTLDAKISAVTTLTTADFEWAEHFHLTPDEVLLGSRVHYDFRGEEGKRWWERILGGHSKPAIDGHLKTGQ